MHCNLYSRVIRGEMRICRDNGKENGSYHIIKNVKRKLLYYIRVHIGVQYMGYIGIMEKNGNYYLDLREKVIPNSPGPLR